MSELGQYRNQKIIKEKCMKKFIDFLVRKQNLWRGLAAIFLAMLFLICLLTGVALENRQRINSFLNLPSSKLVDTGEQQPSDYFKSDYAADITHPKKEELDALRTATYNQAVSEMEEGAVLLKNKEESGKAALPLAKGAKVSLFGHASVNPLYKPRSGAPSLDSRKMDIKQSLEKVGFSVNSALYEKFQSATSKYGKRSDGHNEQKKQLCEPPKEFYDASVRATYEGYKDAAIVVLARGGGENRDDPMGLDHDDSALKVDVKGLSYLALQPNERDMLNEVKSAGFEKIIVVLNAPNPMELEWLEEFDIDACLWVAGAGSVGFVGMANILCGDANPSGRLIDTYAANSLSSPAVTNFGNFAYTNASEKLTKENGVTESTSLTSKYVVYAEGIYTGYKYYETRYEDVIMSQGNAESKVGSSDGGAWNYAKEIVYPFGYGMSYTTFSQELVSGKYDAGKKEFEFEVKVTNTGNVPGKSSVLLYAQTPYGKYERDNKVEKSAIQLVGFNKTEELAPKGQAGSSQTVTITVDKYLLASYDYTNAKGYILSQGDYYFAVGDDVHEALNNVLYSKGRRNLYDQNGDRYSSPSYNTVWKWSQAELDTNTYKYSQYNEGVRVTNQFADMDLNYWIDGGVTYLTRNDWEGTYPVTPTVITLTDDMVYQIAGHFYKKAEDAPHADDFTQGAKNNLSFINMRGVPYTDDETWNKFLDQLTLDDMLAITIDSFASPEIQNVNKPSNFNNDGPDGIRGKYKKYDEEGKAIEGIDGECMTYPNEVILAAAFNPRLLAERGRLLGEESMFASCPQLWSPGANLHRTPFGGRNFEYYSEDSMLNYLCLSIEVKAMQAKGVVASIKHFTGNNQETNRVGLATFSNEQAFRENDLRGFEGGFTKGGASGTMTAYNRIGLRAATLHTEMQENVLRGEWGFKGVIISDAIREPMHPVESLIGGNDMFCMSYNVDKVKSIRDEIEKGDGYLLNELREANKHYYYAYCNSNLANGLTSTMRVQTLTHWWEKLLYAMIGSFGVLSCCAVALYIVGLIGKSKQASAE